MSDDIAIGRAPTLPAPTTCTCGRPKYTPADLKRWEDDMRDYYRAGGEHPYNPQWALAICWTVPDQRCNMKPLKP